MLQTLEEKLYLFAILLILTFQNHGIYDIFFGEEIEIELLEFNYLLNLLV
jgi:hypothetical protein